MTRSILPFLLAAAAVAAPALADAPLRQVRFSRDGSDFVANVSERAGVQTISGTELSTGRRFVLHVNRGHVSGQFDGMTVAYDIDEIRAVTASGTRLSAR